MEDHLLSRNVGSGVTKMNATGQLTSIAETSFLATPSKLRTIPQSPSFRSTDVASKLNAHHLLQTIEKKSKFRLPSRNRPNNAKGILSDSMSLLKWQDAKQNPDETLNLTGESRPTAPKFSSTLLDNSSTSEANTTKTMLEGDVSSIGLKSKRSIMQHFSPFQEKDSNFAELHKSPSGRIDSMFASDFDRSSRKSYGITSSSRNANETEITMKTATSSTILESNEAEEILKKSPTQHSTETENIENNPNWMNIKRLDFNDFTNISNESSILNISDSVLHTLID